MRPNPMLPSRSLAVVLAMTVAATLTGTAAPATSAEDGTRGKVAGFGISRPGLPQTLIAHDLPRIRRVGVNTGMIDVWWDVDRKDATTMHPGRITTSDAGLLLAMQQARAAGLKLMFEPKLWCPSCRPLHWRGVLEPDDRKAFFRAYRSMTNHYADLARRGGVDTYFIGSEMTSLQGSTSEWLEVARQARARFPGRLAYEANWDVANKVGFWKAVDVVSVSAYFPLTDVGRPTVPELKAGWRSSRAKAFKGRNWVREMATLARSTKKPVLFGEAGYISSTYAARQPFDESQRVKPDQQVQANAYQALLETFEGEPWWMGVVWWEWFDQPGSDPLTAMTYTPRDKLAEQLLTAWYSRGWRPSAPALPFTPAIAAQSSNAGPVPRLGGVAASASRDPRSPDPPAVVALDVRRQRGAPDSSGASGSAGFPRGAITGLAALLFAAACFSHRRLVVHRIRQRRRLARPRGT